MKKPLFFAIPVFALLFSCSVEENVADEPQLKPYRNAFADSFAEGFKGLEIDFSKLFDYTTMETASEETERAFSFITKDLQEELAKRPESDHASVHFTLYGGKAILGSLWFGNSERGVFTECIGYHSFGLRPYTYFIDDKSFYRQHNDLRNKNYVELQSAANPNEKRISDFIASKFNTPDSAADFTVYVDATSSKLYGYK